VSLDSVYTQGIKLLDTVTKSIQETVRIKPWVSEDLFGKVTYGATRKYKAVVTRNESEVRLSDGRVIHVRAVVAFLRPILPIGATGRTEPIDVRDKIFLVDDTTGPIVSLNGPTNRPATNVRYFQQVMLG
jgi:hypothetical protein